MARKRKSKKVESLKHRDKRKNIPTEELREFVGEDEEAPPGRLVIYTKALHSCRSDSAIYPTSSTVLYRYNEIRTNPSSPKWRISGSAQ
ncbi:hypothetical protein ES703_108974 [subsurface metagenome]